MNFSERIKLAMDEAEGGRGITQAELARRAKVTRAAINHWRAVEAKEFPMKGKVLLNVCEILGVSPWWLMLGRGEKNAALVSDLQTLELLTYFEALPSAARATAIEQIKQLFNLLSTTSNSVSASSGGSIESSRYREKLRQAQKDLAAPETRGEHAETRRSGSLGGG